MFLLLFAGETRAQSSTEAEQIKNFYTQYMKTVETGSYEQECELKRDFLTPEMQKKLERLAFATGMDPLLRAQDVSDYGRQSLRCRHLKGGWYEVSYQWAENDTTGIHIPIRIKTDAKGKVRITYVTPYWGGDGYGDHLFDIPATKIKDKADGIAFTETFFKAYAYPYVKMSPTLEQDLKQLRQTYCTPAMLKKYTEILQQSLEVEGVIDPLIGCADFDAFFYNSLKVTPLENNHFKVSYNTGVQNWNIQIKVTVTKQNGKYRISDLETE